ncbi:CPBP family intramembrane glutamic endopeptidase [Prolixibacter sp. SD074]|uniref:CPBP family intramembrane glutamic endopeptidase n=1 Tax=Prolixibacter sp. SD074 TaxID=2652391 RepID=UPI0012992B4F|nr:type II CAAX endopeptidase family protein [Prolixibacter sp. SD074]
MEKQIYPNFKQALFLFLILVSSFFIFFLIASGIPKLFDCDVSLLYMNTVKNIAAFIPLFFILYGQKRAKVNVWKMIDLRTISFQKFIFLFLIAASIGIIIHPLAKPIYFFKSLFVNKLWVFTLMRPAVDASSIFSFLSLVVVTPIFEEALLRGIILRQFLKRYSVPFSILITSFFFALGHISLQHFLEYFVWGVILGILYFKLRSLSFCIIELGSL